MKTLFANEPDVIKKIASEKPEYWEYLLTLELLRHGFKVPRQEYKDVVNENFVKSSSSKSPRQILEFIQRKINEIKSLLSVMGIVINEDLQKSWGKPGESGDAIEIKLSTDKLIKCFKQTIEWEKELISTISVSISEEFLTLLRQPAGIIIRGSEEYLSKLIDVFENPVPGKYNLVIQSQLPENWLLQVDAEVESLIIAMNDDNDYESSSNEWADVIGDN